MEGGRGREKRFLLSFPLPRRSFFLLSCQLSGRTRAETLATQATNAYLLDSRPEQTSLVTYHTLPSLGVFGLSTLQLQQRLLDLR